MKRFICDLCRKEIEPSQIRMELPIKVGGKEYELDLHSICYRRMIDALAETIEEK